MIRKVNCFTELLPPRALARADELDECLAKPKMPMGPLHGLPISVKERKGMKDLGYNAGFVAWVGKTAPDYTLVLNILLEAGCVFYVWTTKPQTLVCSDHPNPYVFLGNEHERSRLVSFQA